MLKMKGKTIEITRGNVLPIKVTAGDDVNKTDYEFKVGDVIRFKIYDREDVNKVYLEKDFTVTEICTEKTITMTANEMKIGELSNKPQDYWWEIELNPDTDHTHTIVGYEKNSEAIITILPEGGKKTEEVSEGGDA